MAEAIVQPTPRKRAAAEKVARPHAKTTERREAVLKAALAVFGARGYNNAALAEVAEQAGMTHAGVLHHFGSKEGLLIAVLSYRDGEAIAGVAGRQQVEGPAFLEHLIDTVQQNETRPGVVQTYTVLSAESVTQDHPAQEYFRGRMARTPGQTRRRHGPSQWRGGRRRRCARRRECSHSGDGRAASAVAARPRCSRYAPNRHHGPR